MCATSTSPGTAAGRCSRPGGLYTLELDEPGAEAQRVPLRAGAAMNEVSLEAFQGHLYAATEGKEAPIIDVRSNGGGHTTDRILSSILAAEHAYTLPTPADSEAVGHYPQGRLHAPRYTEPINMVANAVSYSNAAVEDLLGRLGPPEQG